MQQSKNNWSRRNFIFTISGASAAFLFNPLSLFARNLNGDLELQKILANTISIDAHNHMDVPFDGTLFNSHAYDLLNEIKQSGFSAICLTFCVDRPQLNSKGEAYERYLTSLNEIDALLQLHHIKRALNFNDLKTAQLNNEPIVIQSVEGGHFIEDQIDRIEIAYQKGVRHLGLLHDNQSPFALGDIYTDPPKFNGLTAMGKNVIRECNRLGILVDLTHCSNDTINDALKVSTRPIIISHTGLNTQLGTDEKMAKMMAPRLISSKQAKLVADAGGVIGVWTHLAETPQAYAANIRAMVDVVGIDHVCIGTDTKIAPATTDKFGKKTNQYWENTTGGFFTTVAKALLDAGFSVTEIDKIAGANYCRVFDLATR